MTPSSAVRLTLKTLVGTYVVTLRLRDAKEVLGHFVAVTDDMEPERIRDLLAVTWLSDAMKRDRGVPGSMDLPIWTTRPTQGTG
jgi:hypothetical protein